MKKFFYSVLAAGMLFACSQEEIVDVTKGEGQQVTFKVELPSVGQSRAIAEGIEVGAGKYANKLVYAMYEEDQNEILVAGFESDTDKDGVFEVNVPMAKDIKYDILFLAYNEANSAFVINNSDAKLNNLKALQMKSSLSANQEAYDAFIGRVDSKGVDAAATTVVELRRPFAQVNAATTYEDLETAKILKALVSSSKFVIYNAPNTLNVFTGEVSGSKTFTYDQTEILKEYGKDDYPNNEKIKIDEDTYYYYLAMAYVLAGNQSSTHDADFSFYRADDKLVSSLSVLSLPIQANYRTNVLGTLLTQVENYEIKIDAVFGEPANAPEEEQTEKIVVSTAEDLKAAIAAAVNTAGEGRAIGHDIKYTLIELQPGTYTGAFDIVGKNVILMSNDKENTIIDGLVHGLDYSHIVLRNLTLTNATPAQTECVSTDRVNYSQVDYYCLGSYVADWVIENCTFNVSNQGSAIGKGAINIYANRSDYTTSTIDNVQYDLVIKNTTFNCNGQRPIRGKTNSYIEGCTFNDQHRYAIQVQGNEALATETVTFINNKIVTPCQTSGEAFAAAVSISKAHLLENVAFNISGNTIESNTFELKNLVYDLSDNVKITTCTINGAKIADFNCKAIEGVTDAKEVEVIDGVSFVNGEYLISNANGLRWVASVVNATTPYTSTIFDDVTVKLNNDIDLNNEEWIPIGDDRLQRTEWHGVFNGQGYTVKNIKITKKTERDDENKSSYGLFGNVKGTVKNLTVENVSISGAPKFIGALVGRLNDGLVENCHVKNSAVECDNWTIGGLVGQYNNGKISGCTVENTTIKGYAAVGAITGIALNNGERTIENCSVSGCTLEQNGTFGGNFDKMFGGIVGSLYSGTLKVNLNNCTVENTTIKGEKSEAFCGFISEGDKLIIDGYEVIADGLLKDGVNYQVSNANGLATLNTMMANKTAGKDVVVNLVADIDFTGKTWTQVDSHVDTAFEIAVINGNGYTISNLTINGQAMFTRFAGSGDVIIKDITFNNAKVDSGDLNTSILTVQTYQNVLLDNVDVKNSTITGTYKVAPLIATVYNENPSSTIIATLKNCDVENVIVTCTSYDFCTAGMVAFVYEGDNDKVVFENCTVKDVQLKAKPNGYASHAAIYVNDADTDDCFNEATGVTVANVTFEAL